MCPKPLPATSVPARVRAIRVLLVDDQPLIVDAVASMLSREPDIEVIGTAGSIAELGVLEVARPDVVLMDYRLPDGNGTEGCRLVKARWPDARIVVLTGDDDLSVAAAVVEAGADGYLVKTEGLVTVLAAVRAAYAGRMTLSPAILGDIARGLSERRPDRGTVEPLTPRQLVVLKALSRGKSTSAIAAELGLSSGTVRVHVEAIRRKFGAIDEAIRRVAGELQLHALAIGLEAVVIGGGAGIPLRGEARGCQRAPTARAPRTSSAGGPSRRP